MPGLTRAKNLFVLVATRKAIATVVFHDKIAA